MVLSSKSLKWKDRGKGVLSLVTRWAELRGSSGVFSLPRDFGKTKEIAVPSPTCITFTRSTRRVNMLVRVYRLVVRALTD